MIGLDYWVQHYTRNLGFTGAILLIYVMVIAMHAARNQNLKACMNRNCLTQALQGSLLLIQRICHDAQSVVARLFQRSALSLSLLVPALILKAIRPPRATISIILLLVSRPYFQQNRGGREVITNAKCCLQTSDAHTRVIVIAGNEIIIE